MRKYDQEFKKATVKKYLDGQSVASIAREIGVNENTIHKWKAEIIQKDGEPDKEKLLMRKRIDCIKAMLSNQLINRQQNRYEREPKFTITRTAITSGLISVKMNS